MKKIFGVDRVPKVNMLKMPKLGGHGNFYQILKLIFKFILTGFVLKLKIYS